MLTFFFLFPPALVVVHILLCHLDFYVFMVSLFNQQQQVHANGHDRRHGSVHGSPRARVRGSSQGETANPLLMERQGSKPEDNTYHIYVLILDINTL